MNIIPPVDLARQYQRISHEVDAFVLEVLHSGRYIGGDVVKDFEQQFATYTGTSECVSCNSGTDALYLALRALKIGAGDEVITTPFTFIATAEVITSVGATPVFVDIDSDGFNLDVNQIEAAITERTKAIIPVHLFGQPADMTQLMAVAEAHHLLVIEDCAQATGAMWGDKKVGSIGHVGCFSFFPTKNLGGCGDGGAITTNDSAIADSMRMLKEHGSRMRYIHEASGINSRLDALQAAILTVKLQYLDTWNQQRRSLSQRYSERLQPIPGIQLPQEYPGGKGTWNQYTIRVSASCGTENYRNQVKENLQQRGIISMVYYPVPLHRQPVYESLGYTAGTLPQAEQAADEVLSIPMFPDLSLEEQDRVVYALKESLESAV